MAGGSTPNPPQALVPYTQEAPARQALSVPHVQFWYEEYVRQQALIKRGLARMMKAKLAASFNTWRIVTDYLLRLFEKSMKRWRWACKAHDG